MSTEGMRNVSAGGYTETLSRRAKQVRRLAALAWHGAGRAVRHLLELPPVMVARIRAPVRIKLLSPFLGIVTMFVALGAVGLHVLHLSDERAKKTVELQGRNAAYRQLQDNTTEQLYTVASAFLAKEPTEIDWIRRQLGFFSYDFEHARSLAAGDAVLLEQIETDYRQLVQIGLRVVELIEIGEVEQGRLLQEDHGLPLANRLERATNVLINKVEAEVIGSARISNTEYAASQRVVLGVALGSIALALVLGYSISASLINPVRDIRARLRNIAQGDFSGQLDVQNRDEFGDLANNVNLMSRELDRLYRELETANRHKSAFLATMSHELRTPMNAIIGFNRLVMRRCKDVLPEKHYENLGKIAISADHLLTLINTILDLSKIEAGRVDVYPSEFELSPLLEGCSRTVAALLEDTEVVLVKKFDAGLSRLYTDQDKLRQIVLNLLSNAAKFTVCGRIEVAASGDAGAVSIAVSDTGIGIPPGQIERIFEEFTQVDDSTTRQYAGTGLGLAISQRLAALLGGRIDVVSELSVGSTFTLTLPMNYPDGACPTVEERNSS